MCFNFKPPRLTIYEGTDKKGPIVAALEFSHTSYGKWKHLLGDPGKADCTAWEDVNGDGFMSGNFSFQMQLETEGVCKRQWLMWKRTSHVFVGDVRPSVLCRLSGSSYKLVDSRTDQVLAAFTHSKGPSKSGKLEIYVDCGEDFKMMAISTLLGILDDKRRYASNQASAGAGAAGAGAC